MKLINQNLNNYELNSINTGFKSDTNPIVPPYTLRRTNVPVQDVQLPETYYMPENYQTPKTFKDSIKKIDVLGLIHPWFEHPLLMIGTCTGLSLGIDAFDKSCNKDYEKSIIGKAAKFGDKIEKSQFINNETSQKALSGIKKGWAAVKNTAMKNDMINAMVITPSQPEWRMPKDELKHTDFRLVTKFKELASEFNLVPGSNWNDEYALRSFEIKDLALDSTEIEHLKNLYKVDKISQIPEEEVVGRVMLKRLGKNDAEIGNMLKKGNTNSLITKELFKKSGLTQAELEAIFKDETGETLNLVKKASENLKDIKLARGKIILPGPQQPFANIEGFKGIYNRIHGLTDGAETKTGRFMAKLVQKIYRGFTFGSLKQGVMLWMAPFLVGTVVNTIHAENKEKFGTAVSGLINAITWVFTFPLILRAIHAFGGIQYAGMGKEKVEEYRKLINEFNEKVKSQGFSNINEYKTAKKALKNKLSELRKVKNQNLLTKTMRGISKFSKADLMKLESFQSSSANGNFIRKLPNTIKDYLIYAPGRFIIFMFVGMALADKIINKGLKLIFGTPYDSMKDDEVKEAKKKQEEFSINDLRNRMLDIQKNKLYPSASAVESDMNIAETRKPDLVPVSMIKLAEKYETDNINAITPTESKDSESAPNNESTQEQEEFNSDKESIEESSITNKTEELTENEIQKIKQESANEVAKVEPVSKNNDNYSYLPSQEHALKEEAKKHDEYNYIPSSENAVARFPETAINENNDDYTYMPSSKNIIPADIKPVNINNEDSYTYIPSVKNVLKSSNQNNLFSKYIPSQTGVNINKAFDNTGVDAALKRAAIAEKNALDILAGNFIY